MARLVFLGTPAIAVPALRALVGAGHDIDLVVSRPDTRRGRGTATSFSPVKAAAVELGLGDRVTDDLGAVAEAASAGAELGVVVAYGRIIPTALLERLPMVNVHFSLLPRWRGAAPVERALLAGDPETGVCLMKVEAGLDTGPVYATRAVPLDDRSPLHAVTAQLSELGAAMLVELLAEGRAGLPTPVPQVGEPTYASKISPADYHLELWRPAAELARTVRLGRAWTTFRGARLRVLEARVAGDDQTPTDASVSGSLHGDRLCTGLGALQLLRVQPEGGRPMAVADWARGARPADGELLGQAGSQGEGG